MLLTCLTTSTHRGFSPAAQHYSDGICEASVPPHHHDRINGHLGQRRAVPPPRTTGPSASRAQRARRRHYPVDRRRHVLRRAWRCCCRLLERRHPERCDDRCRQVCAAVRGRGTWSGVAGRAACACDVRMWHVSLCCTPCALAAASCLSNGRHEGAYRQCVGRAILRFCRVPRVSLAKKAVLTYWVTPPQLSYPPLGGVTPRG